MGRIQGLSETARVLTGSQLLKTGQGYVFSITLSWTGATAGDKVYLRDGITGAADPLVVFVVPAAHGTITKEWPQGKAFVTGLFYDEGMPAEAYADITWK